MKMQIIAISALALAFSAFGQAQVSGLPSHVNEDLSATAGPEPPMLGIGWARGLTPPGRLQTTAFGSGPNMIYHGGKIMPAATSKITFWGSNWTNASFAGDKLTGLDSFYSGFNFSDYAKTSDEYTGTNGQVGPGVLHQGHIVDVSPAAGGGSTRAILNEVCKQVNAGQIAPDPTGNGYYPVYSDQKRGNAGYCAWHSAGSCSGKPLQFAFFFNLDGDPGCDPADTATGHSQGLAALANVSAHELSEARTDPASPGAWYDSSGEENGDKCAWTFNLPYVVFPGSTKWKLQGEWSNAAYKAGTGYPNSSGQRGCLDGH